MPFEAVRKKIRNLADDVNLDFYQPKKVLAKYGYSQNRLAKQLDVSPASLNGVINGNPSIAQIMVLADAIGCSFFEFFDFSKSGESKLDTNQVKCPACGVTLGLSVQ